MSLEAMRRRVWSDRWTCCSALPGSCGPMPVLMMRSMSASCARRRSSSYF